MKYEGPKVLLTEGKNDCHLIASLCKQHDVPKKAFGFYACESDDRVLRKLSALIASSEPVEIIGVILDSDNPSLEGKWKSLRQRLEKEGYPLPEEAKPGGTILENVKKPRIGIWLMPDNHLDGMLEDFCRQLVDEDHIRFASECVEEAKKRRISTFIDAHHPKAVIHTFLAWQDTPGMPLGQALTAKALDANKPLAIEFSSFLKKLFAPDEDTQ